MWFTSSRTFQSSHGVGSSHWSSRTPATYSRVAARERACTSGRSTLIATCPLVSALRCEGARQSLDAVDERALEHRGLAAHLDVGEAREQLLEHEPDLAP